MAAAGVTRDALCRARGVEAETLDWVIDRMLIAR
jgi:hypothetical protein